MKEIEFYNDQIQDLIAFKKISSMDVFYNKIEELLKERQEIVLIASSFKPESQHRIKFHSPEEFMKWRKKRENDRNRLLELFTPPK
jgi:siroheme synthase (precorrin-2 oxidase/ferrochelatase)